MKRFQGSILILVILVIICWPAALIYFLLKYDEQPDYSYATRTCMGCGANIQINYQVCPYCGRSTNPYSYTPPSPTSVSNGRKCDKCGGTVNGMDNYCQYCGSKQS